MTRPISVAAFLAGFFILSSPQVQAQADSTTPTKAAPTDENKPKSQEELEARFKAMLTKATLSGRWAPIKDGSLGEEKQDKYNIVSVNKVSGDSWIVHAKMKYNDREFVAPIPVKVKWAGDTAVLIVDNMTIPGGQRSYSARVLFYDHTYAGTWSGGDHGGLLNGLITNEKDAPAK